MPYSKDGLKRAIERNRRFVREVKTAGACADCGGTFHHCQMDFDHRPGETKSFELSDVKKQSLDRIRREIRKCDLVCANCHRMRTWDRAEASDVARELEYNTLLRF